MKKILSFLMILILITSSMFAVESTENEETPTTNTDDGSQKILKVVAYKKDKSTNELSMKIIDALTGALATIGDGQRIDMSNYVNKYVDTVKDSYTDLELGKKAIFSIHVSGNVSGTYICTITINEFARWSDTESSGAHVYDSKNVIHANYYLRQVQAVFSDTETVKKDTNKEITKSTVTTDVETYEGSGAKTLQFQWKVSDNVTKKDYWDVRSMVAMVLKTDVYNDDKAVPNGIYEAPITVKLTLGS